MSFLYLLENIRHPILDAFFSFITMFGEETLFMAIAMIVFWCFDKKQGYYLFCVGFFGTVLNQFLKMVFRVPRPWVRDPEFTIVHAAEKEASGYSFPSGHTQSSVGLFGGIARWNKNPWARWLSIAMCILVPLSRLYLGVHTPADVLTSIGIALLLVFVAYPLFQKAAENPKLMYIILGILTLSVIGQLLFLHFYPFPEAVYLPENIGNLESAQKNAYTLLGCMLGFLVIYPLDEKVIRFKTNGVWWAQLLKVVGGLLLVLAVKELLRTPLEWVFGNIMVARIVRYFLIVIMGGAVWPLTFKWFSKLGQKKED